jgi:hypothetical protein
MIYSTPFCKILGAASAASMTGHDTAGDDFRLEQAIRL